MKRVMLLILGTLLMGMLSGCGYNTMQANEEAVIAAWGDVESAYQRRNDLIPNLVETVKGYMGHERGLLSEIADLRSKSLQDRKIGEKGAIETALTRTLGSLMAVAEGYPDLKASRNFLELQQELTEIEDQIQMARRYYNGTVRNLNIAVESFPSMIVARLFVFVQAEFFAIDDAAERQVPPVSLGGRG